MTYHRCYLIASLCAVPLVATAQQPYAPSSCPDTIIVDLGSETINGVPMDTTITALGKLLGPKRIRRETELAEGQPQDVYLLDICGHTVTRGWSGFSWTDPMIRTADGLGVGSQINDFDHRYGPGQPGAAEEGGYFLDYWLPLARQRVFIETRDACFTRSDRSLEVDRTCIVTRISQSVASNF